MRGTGQEQGQWSRRGFRLSHEGTSVASWAKEASLAHDHCQLRLWCILGSLAGMRAETS
jgi:hypothetical protein